MKSIQWYMSIPNCWFTLFVYIPLNKRFLHLRYFNVPWIIAYRCEMHAFVDHLWNVKTKHTIIRFANFRPFIWTKSKIQKNWIVWDYSCCCSLSDSRYSRPTYHSTFHLNFLCHLKYRVSGNALKKFLPKIERNSFHSNLVIHTTISEYKSTT